jgi:hypothetical protein
MNRKLQHTAKALSASAVVFTLLLLAGGPVEAPSAADGASLTSQDSADFMEPTAATETPPVSASQRRRQRHSRALLALPYFSFAQGLRRTRS